MSLTTPAGTRRPRSISTHSAAGRAASAASSSDRNSSRCSTRAGLVAKRSSPASSGAPSTPQSSANWRSLPTARTMLALAAVKEFVGGDAGVAVAHPLRHHARDGEGRALVDQAGEQRREQVDLDQLALAALAPVLERGEDADRGVEAGDHVDEGDADLERLAVGLAGDAHQPAEGLDEEVVARQLGAGAAAAEAGDRSSRRAAGSRRPAPRSRGPASPSRRAGSSRRRRRLPAPAAAPRRGRRDRRGRGRGSSCCG